MKMVYQALKVSPDSLMIYQKILYILACAGPGERIGQTYPSA